MKKIATFLFVVTLLVSSSLFAQAKTETTVKLEWQEQSFIHFYAKGYTVYVSKPEFLDIQNELLVGLFDEFAQKSDSINLKDPFSLFKPEQQTILWHQLTRCAMEGHMLIIPHDSKKKLKNVLIVDDKTVQGSAGTIWECRDPRTSQLIFSHVVATGNPNF